MHCRFILAAMVAVTTPVMAVSKDAPVRSAAPPATSPARIPSEILKASQLVGGRRIDLLIDGDWTDLVEWSAAERYGKPEVWPLESPFGILMFLADRRYEFLWTPLTAWTGAELALLRERLRRKAESLTLGKRSFTAVDSAESVASGRLSDLIRLSDIYTDLGERELAQAVIENYLAAARPRGGNDQRTSDWVIAKVQLANILRAREKTDEAVLHFDDIQRVAGRSVNSVNGAINHAAMLAEVGRYGESLQKIDDAWSFFSRKAGAGAIAGSERQFAWIRACALNGLGRSEEAVAAYQTLRRSGRVRDKNFITPDKDAIEWRAHWCMRREADLKRFLLEELRSERPTLAVLALQPAYHGKPENAALLEKMRADPEIRAAFTARSRELPAVMSPALNNYR